jgi:hypothetical protein
MSGTRELRTRLEAAQAELQRSKAHLEKLRKHHERERDTLQQELEAARRELAALQLRHAEALQAQAQRKAEALQQAVLLSPPPPVPPSALVALVQRPEPLEPAVPALSRLTGLPPADVRLRVAMPLPCVMARVSAAEAEAMRQALHAEGFLAVSSEIPPPSAGGGMTVRRFTLEAQALHLEDARGRREQLPYDRLKLLVRGRRLTLAVEKHLEWTLPDNPPRVGRRGFSAQELKVQELKKEEHSQFLWAYAEGFRGVFTQGTHFQGLGTRRGSSLYESLQNLTAELHQRAPQAIRDDRLLALPRFTMPQVHEERSQELFAELLFQAVKQQVWP